jgi:transposase InsO family protein
VLDSGCTQHMAGDSNMISSLDDKAIGYNNTTFDDNSKGEAKGLGKIAISNDHSLSNVLLFDSLNFHLLSVAQLCEHGYKCTFTSDGVEVTSLNGNNCIFKDFRHESLYLVDFSSSNANLTTCLFSKSSIGWLCHRRLAHVGTRQINCLLKYDLVVGLKDAKFEKDKLCSACQARNKLLAHIPPKVLRQHRQMELFGPTTYRSIGGNFNSLVIVDDYSRYTWVFFLRDKANTYDMFKKLLTRAKNEFDLKVKKVRSDNGSEFKNTRVEELCDEKGMKYEFSYKYTPEQNGLVERKNRTLIDMARSMLSEYNVPDSFWDEAINTACHASNRLYCHRLFNKTPYELLIGRKPNISYFRDFGCKCYILKKGTQLSNFKANVMKDFFLDIHLVARLIGFITNPLVLLKKHVMLSLMKPMGHMKSKKI